MRPLHKVAFLLCLLVQGSVLAQTTNLYHTNRVFKPITLTNFPNISAYRVVTMAQQLTEVVGPTNIFINTNLTKAVEYEGFAWGYESANVAWTSAVAVYQSYSTNHAGMIYDNVGWVKGTKEAYGTWGAFLWYLQNQISFTSSVTNIWISSQHVSNPILQVLVSSLGDYPPRTNVMDVGPTNWALITNFLGSGISTDAVFKPNLDTYYEILIPDLLVSQRTNSLLTTNIFTAMSYPTRMTPTNYHFEIRRASSTNWYTLTNGTVSAYTSVVAVAGNFKLRVTISVTNAMATSLEKDFTVEFPSYAEIESNAAVRAATDAEWINTLSDCTEVPNQRRERGFWIFLNTTSNVYEYGAVVTGAWSGPTGGASIILPPRPADVPSSPLPNDMGAIYPVASFHTHTPTTYRTNYPPGTTRDVGPSSGDNAADTADDVPGVVYDYIESSSGSGSIPMGYSESSPAQRYHSLGMNRRTTP